MSAITGESAALGAPSRPLRQRVASAMPFLVLAPSLLATFVYVFVFTGWTIYISVSDSTLLPTYGFVGLKPYIALWSSRRWQIAYTNLLLFSVFYVVLAMGVGLVLAICIDQRIRAESAWRTIFLYPLAVSFVVTGTVWMWLYSPDAGIEFLVRRLGFSDFRFRLTTDRNLAIYAVIATGIWQSSGFAMALILAGLRSVDQDLVKAAQIDGASSLRIYRSSSR
jgi:glucose/mannose transport system permease protein